MKTVVTSFGGVSLQKDREYAIMCWHLCASLYMHDQEKINMVIGAPALPNGSAGACLKMAKSIANDFKFCTAVDAPAHPDKFCSKIHAMRYAASKSSIGDIVCYLDADVLNFGSIDDSLDIFERSDKFIMTELRKRLREEARKFRSWVIGIKIKSNTDDFLKCWLRNSIKTNHKFSDQIALYRAWKEFAADEDDCMDYREAGLKSCHFGGSKFGSKFQGTQRGPFKKGHSGAMKDIRKILKMQPMF